MDVLSNRGLTRRDLLLRSGARIWGAGSWRALFREPAFGAAASPTPQPSQDLKPARRARTRWRPSPPHFPAKAAERHIPLHGRRTVAGGHIRPQTSARPRTRPADQGQNAPDSVQQRRQGDAAVPGNFAIMARAVYRSATCFRMSVSVWTTWRSSGRWYRISPSTRLPTISCTQAAACRAGPAMGRGSLTVWGASARTCPAFVVLNGGLIPPGGIDCFNSGFLPAAFQGSVFKPAATPVANIRRRNRRPNCNAKNSIYSTRSTRGCSGAWATTTAWKQRSPTTS